MSQKKPCAEIYAIELALDLILKNNKSKHIIFSDLSAITAIKNKKLNNPLIAKLIINLNQLNNKKEIVLCWIPNHIGIKENDLVDSVAKEAQNDATDTNFKILYELINDIVLWTPSHERAKVG